ncbi:hypothetical protein [Microbulbifer sp. 2205BS26-8]|uniref:hypothetical protein n=1 Tax=Microbulbifer sp. 2205BS26-8 TaxID=3064386 RepID=UPI00273FA8BC|nr:hypothetical protein [Microbulbifer sp. 2205BS26-8]MDP5208524.1 hypothetical protein [Microbulbifer sp. 2205BS26-8]
MNQIFTYDNAAAEVQSILPAGAGTTLHQRKGPSVPPPVFPNRVSQQQRQADFSLFYCLAKHARIFSQGIG